MGTPSTSIGGPSPCSCGSCAWLCLMRSFSSSMIERATRGNAARSSSVASFLNYRRRELRRGKSWTDAPLNLDGPHDRRDERRDARARRNSKQASSQSR